MKRRVNFWCVLGVASLALSCTELFAEDSGFLSDYDQLKPVAGTDIRMYTAPNALTDVKNYKAVMIDQPEFVIAADSAYKGFKPDDVKAMADDLRQRLSNAVNKNGRLTVVDEAGPGVLYARIGASNIHLKKKGRNILGYTPAGFVVTTAVSATQGVEEKVILQDMNLEIEIMDSQTQAVLMALVDKIAPGKKSKATESWLKEHTVMDYWATRFNCRVENSHKPQSEWQDCEATLP